MTMGVMTQSEVEEVPDTDGKSTYRPKLRYTYSVAGKDYVGDRYRYGRWATTAGWATQIVASHPVGSRVEVHYAPADPADGVLKVGVEGMDLFLAMFLLPFNLVALVFCITLGRAFRYWLFPPLVGSGEFSRSGVSVPGRVSPWRPLILGPSWPGSWRYSGRSASASRSGASSAVCHVRDLGCDSRRRDPG